MIRVLIADDHPLMRTAVRHILAQEPDFAPPGEAQDSAEALVQIEEQHWDLVVLDLVMPGRDGIETLHEIRRRRPALPVLILSMHAEQHFAVRAIRAGASGYISKSSTPSEVVRAIRKVAGGKKHISSTFAGALADAAEDGDTRPPHQALSDREYQVMCRIAAGKSVSDIAPEMSLSIKTISTYRARALEKLNMHSNAEFVRYAIKNGLVD